MIPHNSSRLTARNLLALVVALAIALGGSLFGALPAMAASAPALTVAPVLVGGGEVTMSGTELAPGNTGIYVGIAPAGVEGHCAADGGTITWGFKESFRSYIGGSIAEGEWIVSDGATYQTPNFGWSGGTGSYDPATHTGELEFTGTIQFTGHGGILNTVISDPRIRFDGPAKAVMVVDVTGTTQDGAEIDETGIDFVTMDLAKATQVSEGGATISYADAPTVLAEAGSVAFGTYEEGEPFDPITMSFTLASDCEKVAPISATDGDVTAGVTAADDSADTSWMIGAAAVAVLLLIVAGLIVALVRRGRPNTPQAPTAAP